MDLIGLGTATPARRYTKSDCWASFQQSPWFERLDRRARTIAELVLQRDNGIEARRLAVDELAEVYAIDPDVCHERFARHAPRLAIAAGERAMADAGLRTADIDAVVVSTCTGYLCPGLSSYVVEGLGLREDVQALDLVGQGCGAALPNWRTSDALLRAGCGNVLSVCVEVSSAAMYLDNDPGVLISACLFGDGAGAALLTRTTGQTRRTICWKDADSVLAPAQRDALRFETRDGMLRNILTVPVPRLAATHSRAVFERVLARNGLHREQITGWIWHSGGRDVLAALRTEFGFANGELDHTAAVLRDFGNISSACVYHVLERALSNGTPPGYWWMSAFGAGFSCHGALLEVT